MVLAAGSGETARILLNSKSASFPDGLCNTHGMVGRYLMDSVGLGVSGQFPALEGLPPTNDDGQGTEHTYVPWWGYDKQKELGFPRGYHIEIGGGRRMPSMGMARPDARRRDQRRRRRCAPSCASRFGSVIGFNGRGEMIPNDDCYCELDPTVKDKWGIPVLRFHWKWGEQRDRPGRPHGQDLPGGDRPAGRQARAGKVETDGRKAISKGGEMIHEVGTARMGHDDTNSVVNQYGQTWAVPNLFVMDGAVHGLQPRQEPDPVDPGAGLALGRQPGDARQAGGAL